MPRSIAPPAAPTASPRSRPERVIREGDPTEQILDVIDKDADIAMLVLAANPGPEGPGPLITMMANTVGSFPIPVTIVSGRSERRGNRRLVVVRSAQALDAAAKPCPAPLDRASAVAICYGISHAPALNRRRRRKPCSSRPKPPPIPPP